MRRPSATFASQLAVFVDFFGLGALLPVLPFFLVDVGADPTWLGLILTFQQGAVCAGSTIIGYLSDRYGRKKFVLLTLYGAIVFFALSAFCQNAIQLLVVRSFAGFSTAVSPSFSWTLAHVTPETRAQAVARWTGALLLGIALGSSSGGLLGEYLGFRWAMLVCSLLTVVVAVVVLLAPKEPLSSATVHPVEDITETPDIVSCPAASSVVSVSGEEEEETVKETIMPADTATSTAPEGGISEKALDVPHTRVMSLHYLMLALSNLCDGMTIMSSHTLMTLILKDYYEWNEKEIGFMFATYAAASFIITLFVFKYVCESLGALRLVIFGSVSKCVSFVVVGIVVQVGWPWYVYCGSVLVFGVVFNVANPGIVVVISSMVRKFEPDKMGTFVGWARSAFSLGQALGPVICVALYSVSPIAPFAVFGTMSLLCGLCVVYLRRVEAARFAQD